MKSYIVDSFTDQPFKGNPAGVCFPKHELTEDQMLNIAKEFGLSETAFVQPTSKKDIYSIRYFSPKKEIPLCGHATLASAKVIFKNSDANEIHFITTENVDLSIRRKGDEIIMEFPIYDLTEGTVPAAMLSALGLDEVVQISFSPKNKIFLLEIKDTAVLAKLNPDYIALLRSYENINGVLVTAPAHDQQYDYHYRYFWPWSGTNEDPVTGGVQTFLAKYWSTRLHKTKMKAFQSSARTGSMDIELNADKVFLISQAVIILEGELMI